MNNGAFGENFPYSNFHDLNMDWIIKIAKDFLDQYTHIQQIIEDGEQSLTNLTESGLEQLQEKADNLEELLQNWYDSHSEDIANQLAEALADLNEWYNTHSEDIANELETAITNFNSRAEQIVQAVIEDIPADYTVLASRVDDVNKDLLAELTYSIMPTEPTGHGLYLVDGSYEANAQYDSFYIPIRGNSLYQLKFNGTSSQYMNANTYDANGTFIRSYGRVQNDKRFYTDDNACFLGVCCRTADTATLNVLSFSTHFAVDYLLRDIYQYNINLMPDEPTGHGLYLSDGTYEENEGWNSYLIPVLPNRKYRMTFTGTSSPYNNTCEFNKSGSFQNTLGRTKTMEFTTSAYTYWIGFATIDREADAVTLEYVTTLSEIREIATTYNAILNQGIMTNYRMENEKTQRPLSNIPANTTIYLRCLSCTDSSIVGLSVYGLAGSDPAENLATIRVGSHIEKIVTTRAYDYIQMALTPYPSGSFTGVIEYSILISNIPGITQDAYSNYMNSVPANLNIKTPNIFKKVVCCGDSFTAGYIQIDPDQERVVDENYSWTHFMEHLTGNRYVNCGVSGANVLTWQTNSNGLPKAQTSGRAQAYLVGLLINDISLGERGVPLGTPADIGTTAETYYGGMSKIIRQLNAINPTAKIFVLTCPQAGDTHQYNEAIRTIVQTYQNTYPVHCLDITKYPDIWDTPSFRNDYINGHYTGLGYEQMAEGVNYCLAKYIDSHISDFQNVHLIPYDN